MANLKIGTFNVRGIRDIAKRSEIYSFLRQKQFDIIMLQETHTIPSDEQFWHSHWGGKIIFSHGASNSKGVAILFRKNLGFRIKSKFSDTQGRILGAHIILENRDILLVNVYAPNDDDPSFFDQLQDYIDQYDRALDKIIGGDFNLVLDINLDKQGGKLVTHKNSVTRLKQMMHEHMLIDIWRLLHPGDFEATWKRLKPEPIMERLDFILISEGIRNLVPNAQITNGYRSDHAIAFIMLKMSDEAKGPGFWKFNTSLLTDSNYCEQLRNLMNELKGHRYESNACKWQFIKSEIRGFTIKYTSQKKRSQDNELAVLDKKIKYFQLQLGPQNANTLLETEQIMARIQELEDMKKAIIHKRVKGAIIRSRKNWALHGEKNSRYFFALEKSNFKKKNRYILRHPIHQTIIEGAKNILSIQDDYYKKLYTSNNSNISPEYLKDLTLPQLSECDKKILEKDITRGEIRKVLWTMKHNKVPGNDGLPPEFYKHFWDTIGTLVENTIFEAVEKGFPIDTRRGIISLMEKPNKDLLELKNWRPLSLLNTDYKILSKILATRLSKILPKIVHEDQSGFIMQRSMSDNIMELTSLVQWCNNQEIEALLVSYDFAKAFDHAEYNILFDIMRSFNIGEKYIQMVRNLYQEIESCTINHGFTGNYFKIKRGLRQGCGFSAPAFTLIVEILGQKIRQNNQIEGIRIGNKHKKLAQYADDLWTIIKANQRNFNKLIETVDEFTRQASLPINYDKTQILRIGSLKNSNAKYYSDKPLQWTDKITILGIVIQPENNEMMLENFQKLISKIKVVADTWGARKLTLLGKVLVVNTLMIPCMTHYFTCLPTPPEKIFKALKSIISNFIWNNSVPKIAYNTMIQSYENGGFKLCDIYAKEQSLKISWVKKTETHRNRAWVNIAEYYTRCPLQQIWKGNLNPKDIKNIFKEMPILRDIAQAWHQLTYTNSHTKTDVLTQSLWMNSHIRIKGTPVYMTELINYGIEQVQHIFLVDAKRFCTIPEIIDMYGPIQNFMSYLSIKEAIPAKWKQVLKSNQSISYENTWYEKSLTLTKLSREAYLILRTKRAPHHDKALSKWNVVLDIDISEDEWKKIRTHMFTVALTTKLRDFQMRLLSHRIVTNINRNRSDPTISQYCTFCNVELETTIHMLYDCKHVITIWKTLEKWLCYFLKIPVNITREVAIMNNVCGPFNCLINMHILICKQTIYAYKCKGEIPKFIYILSKVRDTYFDEDFIAQSLDKSYIHNKKWALYKDKIL